MNHWLNATYETKDRTGKPNGRIIRVWEDGEAVLGYGPKQVYITTLLPGSVKGPHLHRKRDSLFCCVAGGPVLLRVGERVYASGAAHGPLSVHVNSGTVCTLRNIGDEEALVVNVSSGKYDPADDEEVSFA